MNDSQPPSIGGSGKPGLFRRIIRSITGEPWSRDEVVGLLQDAKSALDPEEQTMLEGVLEVSETQVRDVMIPRSQMVVLEQDQSVDDMLTHIVNSGHSRFPVIGEDRDEIVGVLLAKDLLRFFSDSSNENLELETYLRPAYRIPESKRLNTLLKEFRASHNHMAIVVDEYGGVSGLLTIEDVLEEIVGEIDDEHDPEEAEFIQPEKPDTSVADVDAGFLVRALTRVDDFNDYFSCELDGEEYDTVGGLVMHELGRLPRHGEQVQFGGFTFRVTRADRRRIETLRVQRTLEEATARST